MGQFIENFAGLALPKKIFVLGAVAVTIGMLFMLTRAATAERFTLLYAGLDSASAGEVLSALEGMDVAVDVRGEAIYVPESRRDGLRMALAKEGLPRQGQAGFELLDDLNGFATTSEMFDATYWRAKEGELARTIVASPGIQSARVHLAMPKTSSFTRGKNLPSASVTLSMRSGRVNLQQATAARFLVALAVPRLEPEKVAVIDANYGVILSPGEVDPFIMADRDAHGRARAMERDLINLLEARVGVGNARVQIALKLDRESETVSERVLDPETRMLMSREVGEISESGVGAAGVVSVASNLPDGDAAAQPQGTRSERTETNETAQYDVSELRRETQKMPGAITGLSVAVLINEASEPGADGETLVVERSAEEMTVLRQIIATAIGYDETRGDIVTIESMQFHEIEIAGEEAQSGGVMEYISQHAIEILQIVIPALVVIILAIFVIGPLLKSNGQGASEVALAELNDPVMAVADFGTPKSPIEDMRQISADKKEQAAKLIRSWLEQSEPVL